MSAKGQFRPIDDVCAMSAILPIANVLLHYGNQRVGPKGDMRARQRHVRSFPDSDRIADIEVVPVV